MGVDFYPCSNCGEVYCDCGHYVTCDEDAGGCGRDWCSDECAEDDGYVVCKCKLDKDIDYDGYAEEECEYLQKGSSYCGDCENFVKASCSHCRKEVFEDIELLGFALKLLSKTKGELIEEYKQIIKS